MIVRNIYTERKEPLEMFEDERGKILDIFYKDDIQHVAQMTHNQRYKRQSLS